MMATFGVVFCIGCGTEWEDGMIRNDSNFNVSIYGSRSLYVWY